MGALLSKIFGAVAGPLVNAFYGIFKREQKEAKAAKADALDKAVGSVNESIEKEKEIRDKQDEVDKPDKKSDVVVKPEDAKKPEDEGGLNFDSFNEGK